MNQKHILRFGLPKGSLQEATIEKMAKAGFNISVSSRSYMPYVDDAELEIRLIRAQEISRYVEHGYLDCGITGHDWIMENGSKVHEVGEFLFSKATRQPARWVLAVPENSPDQVGQGSRGQTHRHRGGEPDQADICSKHGVKAEVEFSWGATEVKAHELVDAIVEITETGSSLRANKLRIVDTLLTSTPRLIANNRLLEGRLEAAEDRDAGDAAEGRAGGRGQGRPEDEHRATRTWRGCLQSLPALRNPTISNLSLEGWVAVETIIDEHVVRELIPALKAAGAEGIIEYPLNKVVY